MQALGYNELIFFRYWECANVGDWDASHERVR